MKILITGGAGFIGSTLVKYIINKTNNEVINLDKLTYAGNLKSLETISENKRYSFEKVDIKDLDELSEVFNKYKPDSVMHLAAESHVDRSIAGPEVFVQTNIVGTYVLLEVVRKYFYALNKTKKSHFKFHHISTDEVYGDIKVGKRSNEKFTYNPSSPYSASKASADHLIKSYIRTFKIPAIISNCCNNYGPSQFPEKLIPKLIYNIINNKPLPIYGRGKNSREWIHVDDHCEALLKIFRNGKIGESYNVGTNQNIKNINLAKKLLSIYKSKSKIKFVKDRPGHDFRYALDSKKIRKKLKWKPKISLDKGLKETFRWYLGNRKFFNSVSKKLYDKRLGLNL